MKNETLKKLKKGQRIMFPVSELIHPDYNPRTISKEAMIGLKASIDRFGIVQEIVINKRNGHIVGGNQRVDAAIEKGFKEVPIFVVDLPESEEKVLNITLNNPAIQGDFDYLKLEPLLLELREGLGDLVLEELKLDTLTPDLTMPEDEYKGMPNYESNSLGAYKQIIVSFQNDEDIKEFSKLIKQNITLKTKSIWYPKVEKESTKDISYQDAE